MSGIRLLQDIGSMTSAIPLMWNGGLYFLKLGDRFINWFRNYVALSIVKPKVISEALGHASAAFTMDVYSHIIEGMKEDAMALLDEVLTAGAFQKNNANYGEFGVKTG